MTEVRRSWAKWIGMVLLSGAACMALLAAQGSAAEYTDVAGHWAQPAVQRWSDSGILAGYPDGRFGPDDPVTRAQLAEILYRIWGCKPKSGRTYPDLSPQDWCFESLTTMNAYGIALDREKQIRPEEALTREEAFYMVAKAFDIGADYDQTIQIKAITDWAEIDPQYSQRIAYLFYEDGLKGAPDGKFHPKETVTRAEVIQVLDNMFDVYIDEPGRYTIRTDQNALIACSGVTVAYTPENADWENQAKAYLMAGAWDGGVSFEMTGLTKRGHSYLKLYGVTEGGTVWSDSGFSSVKAQSKDLSDPAQWPATGFAGGIGTVGSPYLIETAEQFRRMATFAHPVSHFAGMDHYYFALMDDIELPGNHKTMELGSIHAYLSGNGHTITYHMEDDGVDGHGMGLFASWFGHCSDLTLEGTIDLTVGQGAGVSGPIVGGLAGVVEGTISNCVSKMDITVRCTRDDIQQLVVGGLAGEVRKGGLSNCSAHGSVSAVLSNDSIAKVFAGGLAGASSPSFYGAMETAPGVATPAPAAEERVVRYVGCGSTATVSVQGGEHSMVGGAIGNMTFARQDSSITPEACGVMENCWSTARVSASGASFQSDCGGLVGQLNGGAVRACWAKPSVTAGGAGILNIGGVAGSVSQLGQIADCWADAGDCGTPGGNARHGGITGRMWGEVSDCYVLGAGHIPPENAVTFAAWTDGPVTGCADLTGRDPAQREDFYRSCGWNRVNVWDLSGEYPILRDCDAAAQRAAQSG